MWKAILFPSPPSSRASLGLLVLRLVAGAAMANHGWGKIQNPFHWLDKAESPPPAFLQFLAAFSEFAGGIALLLGALTVLASVGIAFTMMEAVRHHVSGGDPFGKWSSRCCSSPSRCSCSARAPGESRSTRILVAGSAWAERSSPRRHRVRWMSSMGEGVDWGTRLPR